ncbi:MAG TPA: VanW family protein [Candidatus Saccharimonadales bacterium]|nr:VanW family protein [Candidatus Saccharimonadales bacterium]
MTTTTPDTVVLQAEPRRSSTRLRFGVAFLVGLFLATIAGVGAMYAYDQQYLGRVLPGVRLGSIDLSGLGPEAAAERIAAEYASLGEGELVLQGPDGPRTIAYAEFGRGPDVVAMVDEAMGIGRGGDPVSRVIEDARTALRGATIEPKVTYDADALAERIAAYAATLQRDSRDAGIATNEAGKFVIVPGADGRVADPTTVVADALAQLGELDAPSRIELTLPMTAVEPTITTVEAFNAKVQAERVSKKISITDKKDAPSISAKTLRSWITFSATADGGYAPSIDTEKLPAAVKKAAKKIDQAPVNASFKTKGGKITGVTSSKTGYKTDVAATVAKVEALLAARAAGAATASLEPALKVTQPVLTTAEAKAAMPKMKKISSWTTYFPLTIKNGYGVNIWLPAKLINGYVVPPRGKFDFWDAVGPVTRARGFKQGGAIINGKTEPQGALAGGICSCSTTLFNAALRAGYKMGARRNHYYYIDRYPLGLDATVFKSGGGSNQTMSFTNDTDYPLLVRGVNIRKGNQGWVRFDLYSVPTGRKVSFSRPIVKDVRIASDSVQYTSSLPKGTSERIETPTDGKKVWVTRTVRNKAGKVIHRETYYSNYARITGIVRIGTG